MRFGLAHLRALGLPASAVTLAAGATARIKLLRVAGDGPALADRLAALYERVLLAAQARRVGFLDAGREAVATGAVSLADWDLLREAAGHG